ncbi:MAG: class I SAM-dependent methyltransferase [Pseudomonadota bacterium]
MEMTMSAAATADKGYASFWDKTAASYAKRPVSDEAAYQAKLAKIREVLSPTSEVLEFGCGTGSTALALAPHAGSILASDVSGKMLEIAEEKRRAAGAENVSFAKVAFSDQETAEEAYDVVLGMSILHLMPNWREMIAKAHGALKPGGRLITSTVCLSGAWRLLRPVVWLARQFGKAPALAFLSERELRAEMERRGFVIEHRAGQKSPAVFLIARKLG